MERTENGRAILKTETGRKVVALDIVAKLSGTGASRVIAIFKALAQVAEHSGLTVEELVRLENMPTAAPDEARAQATNDYYDELHQ